MGVTADLFVDNGRRKEIALVHDDGHDEDYRVASIDPILEYYLLVFYFKGLRIGGERVCVDSEPAEMDHVKDCPGKRVSAPRASTLQNKRRTLWHIRSSSS